MSKKYENLIKTTAGFSYPAQQPLDDRTVVQNYADLAQLVSSNVAYDGIVVYVIDDQKSYQLIGSVWMAVATEAYVNSKVGQGGVTNVFDIATIADIDTILGMNSIISGTTLNIDNATVENTVLSFTEDDATIQDSTLIINQ